MTDYEFSRPGGRCCVTSREFHEGETFFSAVFETPQGFERRDYAGEAWSGPPEGALCHFQTKLPPRDQPKRTFIDDEALTRFFLALADSEDVHKTQFRFVLALILMRKRIVKYDRTIREEGSEWWEVRLMRDKSMHRVLNPSLDEEQIQRLTDELRAVLAADTITPAQTVEGVEATDPPIPATGP